MKTVRIALLGLGTVGQGVLKIITENQNVIRERTGINIEIGAIFDRSLEQKKHLTEGIKCCSEADPIFDDPSISIVLELIGGVEQAGAYIRRALSSGKHVVTANKALLAKHGEEIFSLAASCNREIGFEAAVAGALPVIKSMRRSLVANRIHGLYGILNGTCNYIITRMKEGGLDYTDALKEAQKLGFAEADPSMDVNGNDTAQKLILLASLAFDCRITEEMIVPEGITDIRKVDLILAERMGWSIRLLAIAKKNDDGKILLRVHPAMVHKDHVLASVKYERNAVFFDTSYSGPMLVTGKGAGALPTAAAVVGDLVAISRNDPSSPERWMLSKSKADLALDSVYRYYLRFQTKDRPGVLAEIAQILAGHDISIATVNQQEGDEPVDVVIITHDAPEGAIMDALKHIDLCSFSMAPAVLIRIVDDL